MYRKVEKIEVKHTSAGFIVTTILDDGTPLPVGKPMSKRDMKLEVKSLRQSAPAAKVIIDK